MTTLQLRENVQVPVQYKFTEESTPGSFEGYGSVFGNVDSHDDVISPGAFDATIAQYKAAGSMPAMYVEHSAFMGGDPLPVGVWTDMFVDEHGLRAKGQLLGLETDSGRRLHELMLKNAMRGLSIAYAVRPGGATARKHNEPRRINGLDLISLDIVRAPSNKLARVDSVKSLLAVGDHTAACDAIVAAMKVHRDSLAGGNSPNSDQRTTLFAHLQNAHRALTGESMPAGMKSMPDQIRGYEDWLRAEFGLSNSQARAVAERGFKALSSRDETDDAADGEMVALQEVRASLAGFTLPKF